MPTDTQVNAEIETITRKTIVAERPETEENSLKVTESVNQQLKAH